jgi:hypothetical protein
MCEPVQVDFMTVSLKSAQAGAKARVREQRGASVEIGDDEERWAD